MEYLTVKFILETEKEVLVHCMLRGLNSFALTPATINVSIRSKSQQLMNEISAYVDQYYSERHTAPSVNEIAKDVGIARTTSYRYLVAMNDLGILRCDGASRTITTRMISKFSESTVPAPVVGAIPCGTPE